MRYLVLFISVFVYAGAAIALTPPLDNSSKFFSGEWDGAGAHGAYCYLKMNSDGHGLVLIDGGTGDWLGARIHWRNQQQTVEVDKIIPLKSSNQLRIMPLGRFTLNTGFNQSLQLIWSSNSNGCYLRKIETSVNHLTRARNVMNKLQSSKGAQ